MASNLEKAPEEVQLPVRKIFIEYVLAHFWSAHEWQKMWTFSHVFPLCLNQAT